MACLSQRLPDMTPVNFIYTAPWDAASGIYRRGARVILTPDRRFITTEPGGGTRDNLGSLPSCSAFPAARMAPPRTFL